MTNRWSKDCTTQAHAPRLPPTSLLILMATVAAACAPVPPLPSTPPEPTVRVIARFGPAVLDPLDPAFLTRLAERSHVTRIDPIRPMSGGAYVLQVACSDPQSAKATADPCASAVARLSRSDAVLGIEVDRREKHQ